MGNSSFRRDACSSASFLRLNVVRDRRNWMPFFSWLTVAVLAVPFTLFFTHFLTWGNFAIAFVYSMVILGTHGTVWYHRYDALRLPLVPPGASSFETPW